MSKQTKTPQNSKPNRVLVSIKSHKMLTVLVLFGVAIMMTVGVIMYNTYMNKFSDKDYAAIESAAENILKGAGATQIYTDRSCQLLSPAVYARITLFCGISMATYLPYENEEQAIEVAKSLEREIVLNFNSSYPGFKKFYEKPFDGYAVSSVTLQNPSQKSNVTSI